MAALPAGVSERGGTAQGETQGETETETEEGEKAGRALAIARVRGPWELRCQPSWGGRGGWCRRAHRWPKSSAVGGVGAPRGKPEEHIRSRCQKRELAGQWGWGELTRDDRNAAELQKLPERGRGG